MHKVNWTDFHFGCMMIKLMSLLIYSATWLAVLGFKC